MPSNEGHDNWITVTVLLARRAGDIVAEHAFISLTQYRVLIRLLANDGSSTNRGLCTELGLSPSTITSAVNDLQARGAVSRTEDDGDGRVVHLVLKDRGLELIHLIDPAIHELVHDFWSVYDEHELAVTKRDSAETVLGRRLAYIKTDGLCVENAYVESALLTLDALNRHMKRANISLNEYRVLHLLYKRGALRPKDISRALLLRSNEVTVAATKLARHHRIERVRIPEDQRAAILQITDEGRDKILRMTPGIVESFQHDITPLSEDAFEVYDSIAGKVLTRYSRDHLIF
jgi:MarR family 2-MHQ and catechol resistance regulon transcriptional repressor